MLNFVKHMKGRNTMKAFIRFTEKVTAVFSGIGIMLTFFGACFADSEDLTIFYITIGAGIVCLLIGALFQHFYDKAKEEYRDACRQLRARISNQSNYR